MSRCFPFPPPGYERKHKTEDLDLLKEAKRKEKKHKKEKKDKERKKDKEKEKDGSDEKQKDKKDRKGKHKDKKEKHKDNKDKEDRVKDKEKSSISEESTVAVKVEDKSGGKLHPKVHSNDRNSFLNDGKCFALFQGKNGGKPSQSMLPSLVNDESKFIRELDRRIRDEEKGTGSQLPEKVAVLDNKHQEMVARAARRNSSGLVAEEKVDNKNKKIERKLDPRGFGNEYGGNTMVQDLTPLTKSKVGVIPKPVDKQNGRRLEDKDKYKETGGVKRGDKQKDRDKESQAKEKDKEKEKKKDVKTENKKNNQNQSKDVGRNDFGGFTGNKTTDLLKDTNCTAAANEGNIRKRKDMSSNGFLHESEIRPNKMQRPGPHQLIENGRKLEPSQTPTKSPHDKHAVPSSVGVNSIERLTNGIIVAPKPSPSMQKAKAEASKKPLKESHHMRKPLKVPKVEDLIAEASRRPPHPDSKYMLEVLTVPKMEEWSENDDQDWLVSKKSCSRKPNVGPIGVKEYPPVWSETVHIESADVYALPYVIPY
ncbi:hypothetical protein ACS0TY_014782 [Phlomoides rotata]